MKQGIQKLFGEVTKTYELVNHILTFGGDVLCRRQVANLVSSNVSQGDFYCLDICTGTGEMARLLKRGVNGKATVIGGDFCYPMLLKARAKSTPAIQYLGTEAQSLPFGDNSFDLITISFATRNLRTSDQSLLKCLTEFYRIIKPGGMFIHLETSQPESGLFRWIFHRYVKTFVKPIGGMISGNQRAYGYLSHTIPQFYNASEFSQIIRQAGFENVKYKLLWGGVAAIHVATK